MNQLNNVLNMHGGLVEEQGYKLNLLVLKTLFFI